MASLPSRTDIVTAMRNPSVSYKATDLIGGNILFSGQRVIQYSGGYSTVFPFLNKNKNKIAVRCWVADIGEAKKRTQSIASHLSKIKSKYFVNFTYIENGILVNGNILPVVLMDWVNGQTLKEFLNSNFNNPATTLIVADNFKSMVQYFHQINISHGDLQHGNIMIKDDNSLLVIDYDSMYVEELNGMPDIIKGLEGYQHPTRQQNKNINPKLDYFSELVIYLSLLVFADKPNLWKEYYDTEDLLFSKQDFQNPITSKLFNSLLKSTNPKIVDLTSKLIECLKCDSIDKLDPLEDILINKLEVAKENIFDKWNNQPNPPAAKITILPSKDDIINKF